MPISEAKKRANKKWDEEHRDEYWRATIVFPAEERETVQERARARGQSVSDYIRELVRKDLNNMHE